MADSSGVMIVSVTPEDRVLPWGLSELFRIGGAEEGPGSFTNAHPTTVATDDRGHIYVLDARQSRVEVFDNGGRHVRFLGRKGSGPGELDFPALLAVEPSGTVGVFDYSRRALVRWGPDGELLPQQRIDGLFPSGAMQVRGDTVILAHDTYADKSRVSSLKIMTPTDTTAFPELSSPTSGMIMFSCVGLNLPPLFSPEVAWSARGSTYAVSNQVPYQVDIYENTTLRRSVRRTIAPEAPALSHVNRLYPDGMKIRVGGGTECVVNAQELLEKQGAAPHMPQLRSLMIDPAGWLWVERYTLADEATRTDVFDAEGVYRGTLAGKGRPLGFIGGEVVLLRETDEDTGIVQIVAFRISDRG